MELTVTKVRQKHVDLKMSKQDLMDIVLAHVLKENDMVIKEGLEVQTELKISKKNADTPEYATFELTIDGA
jgi:hypothetical protein